MQAEATVPGESPGARPDGHAVSSHQSSGRAVSPISSTTERLREDGTRFKSGVGHEREMVIFELPAVSPSRFGEGTSYGGGFRTPGHLA